jgi:hypothetical protein
MILSNVELSTKSPVPNIATGAPDALKKNLDWYIAHQQELATKHNGKILLIVDQKLINIFDDFGEAYNEALKTYLPGSFTLQPCSPEAESYTLMLYSPVYGVMG